ncbi:hypothetical protein ACFSTC_05695 [Nonomuraea ferruginea]
MAAAVGGARDGDGRAPKRCRYAVRRIETRLNVRGGPGTRYRIVDKLYPGDYTWGELPEVRQVAEGAGGRRGPARVQPRVLPEADRHPLTGQIPIFFRV